MNEIFTHLRTIFNQLWSSKIFYPDVFSYFFSSLRGEINKYWIFSKYYISNIEIINAYLSQLSKRFVTLRQFQIKKRYIVMFPSSWRFGFSCLIYLVENRQKVASDKIIDFTCIFHAWLCREFSRLTLSNELKTLKVLQ